MRRLLTVLVLLATVSTVATGVVATEFTYAGPGAPSGNVWANPLNWDPDIRYPGAGDIARHDFAEEDSRGWILMNAPHSPSTPWPVDEFRAIGDWDPQEPGALILEGYCDRWMPSVCDGDHIRWIDAKDGASSSVLNGYEIYVGPKDAFVVGNPFPGQTPNPNARADNFSRVLHGEDTNPAWVVSPAGFGPGRWNIDDGYVYAGIEAAGWDIEDFTPIGAGIIDSDVQNTGAGNSEWFIFGALVLAKEYRNLDHWDVQSRIWLDEETWYDKQINNHIVALEYLEVNTMTYEAMAVDGHLDQLIARVPSGSIGIDDEVGLHVLGWLVLSSMLCAEGDTWPQCTEHFGPEVKAEHLNVRPGAMIIMGGGTKFYVWHGDGTATTGHARFQDGAQLRYQSSALIYDLEPDPAISPLRFEVMLAPESELARALVFEGDSYITRAEIPGPVLGWDLDLALHDTSLKIESRTSQTPAIQWDTSVVDLEVSGALDSITVEVIAEDNCEVWFVDVVEPRCLKYWRSMSVDSKNNQPGMKASLVDTKDNHVCGTPSTPKDGALYIVGELNIATNDLYGELDANGMHVYYGSLDLGEYQNGVLSDAVHKELVFSVYGDFDGDCCVDQDDYDAIVAFLYGVLSRCDWPNADWNGDCQVDYLDVAEVLDRVDEVCYDDGGGPCPNRDPIEDCPFLGEGDGPEQGGQESEEVEYLPGMSPEAIAALGDAIVAYLVRQDPRDSGEQDTAQHMIDSFDRLTAMYFDGDQKAALADVLEKADYASDTVAELTATLVTKLRG